MLHQCPLGLHPLPAHVFSMPRAPAPGGGGCQANLREALGARLSRRSRGSLNLGLLSVRLRQVLLRLGLRARSRSCCSLCLTAFSRSFNSFIFSRSPCRELWRPFSFLFWPPSSSVSLPPSEAPSSSFALRPPPSLFYAQRKGRLVLPPPCPPCLCSSSRLCSLHFFSSGAVLVGLLVLLRRGATSLGWLRHTHQCPRS